MPASATSLASPGQRPAVPRQRRFHLDQAVAAQRVKRSAEALQRLNAALSKARSLPDLTGEALTLVWIGVVNARTGEPKRARPVRGNL